jgi:predicted RNase H-like nuclease
MVVWKSLNEWESWRSRLDTMSDSKRKAQQKEYDAFVAKYNENTKVVAQNRWCML